MDFQYEIQDGFPISRPSASQGSLTHYQPQVPSQNSLLHIDQPVAPIEQSPVKNSRQARSALTSTRSSVSSKDSITTKPNDFDPIDELTDLTYVLDPVGQILYASSSVHTLFEHTLEEVVGHNIMEFIHNDDVRAFVTAFNDAIMNNTALFHYHRFRRRAGEFVILETNGHAVYSETDFTMNQDGRAVPACKCCILSARAYPTPPMTALDSFLELKLANERLKAELRELGETDPIVVQPPLPENANAKFMAKNSSNNQGGDTPGSKSDSSARARPKSALHTPKAVPGTVQSDYEFPRLNAAGPLTVPFDSPQLVEKHTPNGTKPRETGEPVREQGRIFKELSKSSSGQSSTKNILSKSSSSRSDQALTDETQLRKKNKKTKVELEKHVCSDCQTTDSPEWRKGPQGPKTLCNACGLRYSKKQKKTEQFLQLHNSHNERSETSTTHSSESGRERSIKSRSVSESQTPNDVMGRSSQPYSWGPETHGFQAVLKGATDETFSIGLPYWPP